MALRPVPLGAIRIGELRADTIFGPGEALTAVANHADKGKVITEAAQLLKRLLKDAAKAAKAAKPTLTLGNVSLEVTKLTEQVLKAVLLVAATTDDADGLLEGVTAVLKTAAEAKKAKNARASGAVDRKLASDLDVIAKCVAAVKSTPVPEWVSIGLAELWDGSGANKARGHAGRRAGKKTEADIQAIIGGDALYNVHVVDELPKGVKAEADGILTKAHPVLGAEHTLLEFKTQKLTLADLHRALALIDHTGADTNVRVGSDGEVEKLGCELGRLVYILGATDKDVLYSFAANTRKVVKNLALRAAVESGTLPAELADGKVVVTVGDVADGPVATLKEAADGIAARVRQGTLAFFTLE